MDIRTTAVATPFLDAVRKANIADYMSDGWNTVRRSSVLRTWEEVEESLDSHLDGSALLNFDFFPYVRIDE